MFKNVSLMMVVPADKVREVLEAGGLIVNQYAYGTNSNEVPGEHKEVFGIPVVVTDNLPATDSSLNEVRYALDKDLGWDR
jgi:hypothetical protein